MAQGQSKDYADWGEATNEIVAYGGGGGCGDPESQSPWGKKQAISSIWSPGVREAEGL